MGAKLAVIEAFGLAHVPDVPSGAFARPVERRYWLGLPPRIVVMAALFWAAVYGLSLVQAVLIGGREDGWVELSVRACLHLVAFSLSLPLAAVVDRAAGKGMWRQLLIATAASAVAALPHAALNVYVWTALLPGASRPASPQLIVLVATFIYWYVMFAAFAAFASAAQNAVRLREREQSLAEAREAAREAELRMLRYQINPHFLFNTLNAISAMVVGGDAKNADAMITRLAAFYRSALTADPSVKIALADEVATQRNYLEMEQARFSDRMRIEIDIEPGLAKTLVPQLLLQPLVENAVKHGVARLRGPVTVRLAAIALADRLVISVDNDAPAIGADAPDGARVGLRNIAARLHAIYGDEARLSAGRLGPEGGYRTRIELPLEYTL